jgi:DNA invertase Pin-like site-specific DNA recombinase
MAVYGYARVSSADQSTATQVQRLKEAGCEVVRKEKVSGKAREGRDELATLLEFITAGDVLVCVKLDRLGRSTRDVLNLVHELDQKGASLRILEPAISTDGPMGKMVLTVLTVLGMVAEMELGFIKARQREGIERAKSQGDVYRGRKPTIDPSAVRELFNQGIGASEIARRLKIGRASVYRVLET